MARGTTRARTTRIRPPRPLHGREGERRAPRADAAMTPRRTPRGAARRRRKRRLSRRRRRLPPRRAPRRRNRRRKRRCLRKAGCMRACVRAWGFGFERNGVCASGQNVSFRSSASATRERKILAKTIFRHLKRTAGARASLIFCARARKKRRGARGSARESGAPSPACWASARWRHR